MSSDSVSIRNPVVSGSTNVAIANCKICRKMTDPQFTWEEVAERLTPCQNRIETCLVVIGVLGSIIAGFAAFTALLGVMSAFPASLIMSGIILTGAVLVGVAAALVLRNKVASEYMETDYYGSPASTNNGLTLETEHEVMVPLPVEARAEMKKALSALNKTSSKLDQLSFGRSSRVTDLEEEEKSMEADNKRGASPDRTSNQDLTQGVRRGYQRRSDAQACMEERNMMGFLDQKNQGFIMRLARRLDRSAQCSCHPLNEVREMAERRFTDYINGTKSP